jgi:hypothetical protein
MCSQQCLNFVAQVVIVATRFFQKRFTILRRNLKSSGENGYFAIRIALHVTIARSAGYATTLPYTGVLKTGLRIEERDFAKKRPKKI